MRGIFILSLDTELAWGTFDLGGLQLYRKHFDNWRINTGRLIELLERYHIKATWDFVGHLFLDRCDKIQDMVHPEIRAPEYKDPKKRWRLFDPGTDRERDPYWYGRDILERVKTMKPSQEIATHTFSHVLMDDSECTREVAVSEIKKCIELAKAEGIEISTIVFPRNRINHLDVAREFGIRVYRGGERGWHQSFPTFLKKPIRFLHRILLLPPPVYRLDELQEQEGVLEIPASMFLLSYDGWLRKSIPSSWRVVQAKKGIEAAMRKQAIFHLWFHPFNLASSECMFKNVEEIFRIVRNAIDAGKLHNLTMREVEELFRIQSICETPIIEL